MEEIFVARLNSAVGNKTSKIRLFCLCLTTEIFLLRDAIFFGKALGYKAMVLVKDKWLSDKILLPPRYLVVNSKLQLGTLS